MTSSTWPQILKEVTGPYPEARVSRAQSSVRILDLADRWMGDGARAAPPDAAISAFLRDATKRPALRVPDTERSPTHGAPRMMDAGRRCAE
jgi:hypothetical protein